MKIRLCPNRCCNGLNVALALAVAAVLLKGAVLLQYLTGSQRLHEATPILMEDVMLALGESNRQCAGALVGGSQLDPARSRDVRLAAIALYDREGGFIRDVVRTGEATRLKGIHLKEIKLSSVAEVNSKDMIAELQLAFTHPGWWSEEELIRRVPLYLRHRDGRIESCSIQGPISTLAADQSNECGTGSNLQSR